MSSNRAAPLLSLRMLVGYLGEKSQFAWWSTSFFDSPNRLFLEPVFARTATLAQYHGVSEAARRLHDEHLSVGAYHLFRLPEEVEQDIHNLAVHVDQNADFLSSVQSKDLALQHLERFTSSNALSASGPTMVGNIRDLGTQEIVQTIASIYLSAFRGGVMAYPYLKG